MTIEKIAARLVRLHLTTAAPATDTATSAAEAGASGLATRQPAPAERDKSRDLKTSEPTLPHPVGGWRPIETAPKDGTLIDLWGENGRVPNCYWGKPEHECGEAGRYCDSDWHSESPGWVEGDLGVYVSRRDRQTHWQPLPAPPPPTEQTEGG